MTTTAKAYLWLRKREIPIRWAMAATLFVSACVTYQDHGFVALLFAAFAGMQAQEVFAVYRLRAQMRTLLVYRQTLEQLRDMMLYQSGGVH